MAETAMLALMSVECTKSDSGFTFQGIEGYPCDVLLEWAKPGWSARPSVESDPPTRDSALTRSRAAERLLIQTILVQAQLAAIMEEVEAALEGCPE